MCVFECVCGLPSPDSDSFVGEGGGCFPQGGLSDAADSLGGSSVKESVVLKYIR